MVWPGLTKPIQLGDHSRPEKEAFDVLHEGNRRARAPGLARTKQRGWSGRAWPGKHVGQPQNETGGKCQ